MFWTRNQKNGNYAVVTSAPKPLARTENLIVQVVDDEVLVYDSSYARAHCLSPDGARMWRACDGEKTIEMLAAELEMPEASVVAALAELEEKELLDNGRDNEVSNGNGATRREFGLRAAKIGAAAAATPIIVSIVAPTSASAGTPTVQQCLFYSAKSCAGCAGICGCCCCCQGCSSATEPACKLCYPIDMCGTDPVNGPGDRCDKYVHPRCSSGPSCSDTAKDPPDCKEPCPVQTECGPGGQPCNCFGIGNPCQTP